MKSMLIAVLSLTLTVAAFMTRPTEADFVEFVGDQTARVRRSLPERLMRFSAPADVASGQLSFRDRILWVQVEDEAGKVLYTGVFDHWFGREVAMPIRQGPRRHLVDDDTAMLALPAYR